MRISISMRKKELEEMYGMSEGESAEAIDLILETIKPVTLEIYEKFSGKHDSNKVANEILSLVKNRLFKDSSIKIVMRAPAGERKEAGTVLNHVKIKMDEKEIPLSDYLFHMAAIRLNRAFIKIK
jgi:hypothetical protein